MAGGYRSNETVIGLLLKANKVRRGKKGHVKNIALTLQAIRIINSNLQLVHLRYQNLHQYSQEGCSQPASLSDVDECIQEQA